MKKAYNFNNVREVFKCAMYLGKAVEYRVGVKGYVFGKRITIATPDLGRELAFLNETYKEDLTHKHCEGLVIEEIDII